MSGRFDGVFLFGSRLDRAKALSNGIPPLQGGCEWDTPFTQGQAPTLGYVTPSGFPPFQGIGNGVSALSGHRMGA